MILKFIILFQLLNLLGRYNEPSDKSFIWFKEEGGSVFVFKKNGKLKFKPPNSGISPYLIGTWHQEGDTISLKTKISFITEADFIYFSSYYFDALVPLDESYSEKLNFLRLNDVADCKSQEIYLADSLVSVGVSFNALAHPRTEECIKSYFLDTDFLISPNEVYN